LQWQIDCLKSEYSAKISHRIENLYCALSRLLRESRPILQHRADSALSFGSGPDKTESIFGGKIPLRASVFCHYGPTQSQKGRSAIADPSRAPRHVHALDSRELGKRGGEVAAVRPRCAGDAVWIGDLPSEPAQSFPFGILRSDIHRKLKPRLGHARWKA
jgi:hypothetical protein